MQATIPIPQKPDRNFLPNHFNLVDEQSIAPFYEDLLNRNIDSLMALKEWLKDYSELTSVIGENVRWRYIKTSINTEDKEAKKNLELYYTDIEPSIKVFSNKLKQKINTCPFTSELQNEPEFRNFLKGVAIDLSIFNEANIELQKQLSLKENEYAVITGQWMIEYDGKQLTLQQAAKYLKSKDRQVREEVYKAIQHRRLEDEQKLDNLYTELIQMRQQIAVNAGYENYRDYVFDAKHRFDYTASDCEEFQNSVAETIVPVLDDLLKERKSQMGLDVLKPWDTAVDPLGRDQLQPFDSTEAFVEKSIACFDRLDPYFGERLAIMREMKYLDLESRKGKAPGGYNMTMPEIGVPFIFMNHAKSEGDVRVMVHEGGHAVHTFLAHELAYDFFKDYPSEVAELASMSMELFSMEHWNVFYENEEDLNRAKKNHLIGLLNTLPGVARGDDFQHWVYLNPTHSVAQRKEKWTELHHTYTSNVVDYSDMEKDIDSSYHRILHFYQVPFYYVEYGFAQLGAIAMWKNFKENPSKTIQQYKDALSLGYTKSIPEIYETAGIRFDFSKNYINELATFVKEEIDKLG